MEFTQERILERKLKTVEAAIFEDVRELTVWQTKQGFYASPGEYTNYGQWEEISLRLPSVNLSCLNIHRNTIRSCTNG